MTTGVAFFGSVRGDMNAITTKIYEYYVSAMVSAQVCVDSLLLVGDVDGYRRHQAKLDAIRGFDNDDEAGARMLLTAEPPKEQCLPLTYELPLSWLAWRASQRRW